MTRIKTTSLLGATLLAFASSQAHAQAYTQPEAAMRVGPGEDWPIVTELPPSTYVRIVGCDPRYRWCQVNVPNGLQGWVPGDKLRDVRDDQPLRIDAEGHPIDFPVLVFTGAQLAPPMVPGPMTQSKSAPQPKPAASASATRDGGREREPVFPARGGPR
jgi:uncharacterized protein YraI